MKRTLDAEGRYVWSYDKEEAPKAEPKKEEPAPEPKPVKKRSKKRR